MMGVVSRHLAISHRAAAMLLAAAMSFTAAPAAAQDPGSAPATAAPQETVAPQDKGAANEQSAAPSDDQVNEIAGDLYCPVCPNTPLDVCETLACSEWREQIREQIAAGMSESEITDYFVEQYGERVLAKPRRSGFTLVLWILPLLGLALGLVALGAVLRRWRHHQDKAAEAEAAPVPAPEGVAVSSDVRRRIEEELRNLS